MDATGHLRAWRRSQRETLRPESRNERPPARRSSDHECSATVLRRHHRLPVLPVGARRSPPLSHPASGPAYGRGGSLSTPAARQSKSAREQVRLRAVTEYGLFTCTTSTERSSASTRSCFPCVPEFAASVSARRRGDRARGSGWHGTPHGRPRQSATWRGTTGPEVAQYVVLTNEVEAGHRSGLGSLLAQVGGLSRDPLRPDGPLRCLGAVRSRCWADGMTNEIVSHGVS